MVLICTRSGTPPAPCTSDVIISLDSESLAHNLLVLPNASSVPSATPSNGTPGIPCNRLLSLLNTPAAPLPNRPSHGRQDRAVLLRHRCIDERSAPVSHEVQAARSGPRRVLQRPLRGAYHGVDEQAERALRQVQGVDTISAMKTTLDTLRRQLATDTDYFRRVYNYTFEFSRPPGQRSLGLDMAQGFWTILLPHGLHGGALAHVSSGQDADGDERMAAGEAEEGWKEEYTQWWFEFLEKSGLKGVSKDVWQMVSAVPGCE
ncbi:hypothetical protein FKP32DRAFT_1223292 [Trametes sanguinea]|nr:hypothetical protein FKP32DRAFT_1223292 [Trametes sanguinea]